MTDILPIDISKLKPDSPEPEPETESTTLETIEEENPKELFEKPEEVEEVELPKKNIEIQIEEPKKVKKKRKPLSPEHLAKLAVAREKSLLRRAELKEAKQLEAATKRLERKNKIESKIAKKMEEDAVLEMKAKIYQDAKTDSTFDEDRLMKLMEKTIDNYIDKKKKAKPMPNSFVPSQNNYPQYAPQVDPKYYQPAPTQQQQYYQQPQQPQQQQQPRGDAVSNLFGFN